MVGCPVCGSVFDTKPGLQSHFGKVHPNKNLTLEQVGEERLRAMYLGELMSENEIAQALDVAGRGGVQGALEHLGIRRGQPEAERVKNQRMTEEERREQTQAAREAHFGEYGDGGYLTTWFEENPERAQEIRRENGSKLAEIREENGMAGVTGQDHPNWRGGKSIYDAVKKQLHGPSWNTLRDRHLGDECQCCGAVGDLELHHVVPLMSGGTHHPENLMTLCVSCHYRAEWYIRDLLDPVLTE